MNQKTTHTERTEQYWNRKSTMELTREDYDPRKQIHTDLLWREITRIIDGRQNLEIFDAGGGPGRFAIPLAQHGHHVTLLDISSDMLKIAQQRATEASISSLEFKQQSICQPFDYPDDYFDLVLCLDSPLSYCVENYKQTLTELVRVSNDAIILCVVNKLGAMLEDGAEFDLEYYGKLKTQKDLYATGNLIVNEDLLGFQPTLMPSWHAFTPLEIKELANKNHCKIKRLMAPGTFARFVDPKFLPALTAKPQDYEDFLTFVEEFDQNPDILGVGASNAGGLLVSLTKT